MNSCSKSSPSLRTFFYPLVIWLSSLLRGCWYTHPSRTGRRRSTSWGCQTSSAADPPRSRSATWTQARTRAPRRTWAGWGTSGWWTSRSRRCPRRGLWRGGARQEPQREKSRLKKKKTSRLIFIRFGDKLGLAMFLLIRLMLSEIDKCCLKYSERFFLMSYVESAFIWTIGIFSFKCKKWNG